MPRCIETLAHASAGWSNETVLVTLSSSVGHGGDTDRLVVRLPPLVPSFPDDQLLIQARVQEVAAGAGIPAPAPVTVVTDEQWLGAPFLVMPFVAGHVPGQAPAFDPWVTGSSESEQQKLYEAFLSVLASVHRVGWAEAGLGDVLRGGAAGTGTTLGVELDWWDAYLTWSFGDRPLPALVAALGWCRANKPASEPPASLLWGDPRLGNLVVGDRRQIAAVLDWEMASIGPAEMDLGWVLGLEWSTAELVRREVPGFLPRADAVTYYEAALGRSVVDLEWFEVFALVRSLAISNHQARTAKAAGVRYAMGADEDNPMVALVSRRIAALGG